MKCAECKYQWCWLCEQQYNYDHYKSGSCNGLQFFKAKDEEHIKKVLANPNDENREHSNVYLNDHLINLQHIDIPHENRNINNLSFNYRNFQRRVNWFYEFIIYFFFTPFIIYINYISNLDFNYDYFGDESKLFLRKIVELLIFFNLFFFYYIIYFI